MRKLHMRKHGRGISGRVPKRISRFGTLLALTSLFIAYLALPAAAIHLDNFFELGPNPAHTTDEGGATNILGDGVFSNGPDWADLFTSTGGFKDLINATGATTPNSVSDYIDFGGSAAG